jgi:hypothetical protein
MTDLPGSTSRPNGQHRFFPLIGRGFWCISSQGGGDSNNRIKQNPASKTRASITKAAQVEDKNIHSERSTKFYHPRPSPLASWSVERFSVGMWPDPLQARELTIDRLIEMSLYPTSRPWLHPVRPNSHEMSSPLASLSVERFSKGMWAGTITSAGFDDGSAHK